MAKYKLKLLQDLPEYPKDTVFICDDEWRAYWDGGNFTIPRWLEELLDRNLPAPQDEMLDWFEPVVDSETTYYDVNIRGDVTERTVYDFWYTPNDPYTFTDKKVAEKKAQQIKEILAQP